MPVVHPVQEDIRLHVADAVAAAMAAPFMQLAHEAASEALLKVECKGADKGGVVPRTRIGVVPEVGEVEDGSAALHGTEYFLGEMGVALLEDSEGEGEGLEGNHPVLGAGKAAGKGVDAGGGALWGGGSEEEDLMDMAFFDDLVMGGCLEDSDVEV